MYDFANILLAGPCNARCPFCIGRQIDPRLIPDNLELYPLHNLDGFVKRLRAYHVQQVVLTGANSDPLLYRHLERTLDDLREMLPAATQFSLHSNGRLALQKIDLVNRFDRVCLSIPSFDPDTYQKIMGVRKPPDLAQIVRCAGPPIKVSCVLTSHNIAETADFLYRCRQVGVHRVVLRKLVGERRPWRALLNPQALGLVFRCEHRRNPVYDYEGMEVTAWDFEHSSSASLNLFSSGLISDRYLLQEAEL